MPGSHDAASVTKGSPRPTPQGLQKAGASPACGVIGQNAAAGRATKDPGEPERQLHGHPVPAGARPRAHCGSSLSAAPEHREVWPQNQTQIIKDAGGGNPRSKDTSYVLDGVW